MNPSKTRWLFGALTALVLAGCNSTAPFGDRTNGSAPNLIDFPEAPQSLVFSGQFGTQVSTGQPTSCGWGTGPTGPVYGYTVYFEAGDGLLVFNISTNPGVEPYKGPGIYHAHASLVTVGPHGPPTGYEGVLTFVVSQDPLTGRVPGGDRSPNTGTVNGAFKDTHGHAVNVSGGWTCVPSQLTGPG